MRALILVTMALGLAGCGGDDPANNTVNIDQAVMSNALAANDVTAIDAVTGDAANMAADVDIAFTNDALARSGSRERGAKAESPKSRPRSATARPETDAGAPATPVAEPAANTTE